ncbi:MAG: plasmid pRiA4b ORF-3 family protein [Bacteroidia bacterium]|nr:plasmid pRiA4b ORF-3 family protein [Bacteroidia bacterium]
MTYQFKITLIGSSKPEVWRRIKIDPAMSFDDLHGTIQAAMGWDNYHLYAFGTRGSDRQIGPADEGEMDDMDEALNIEIQQEFTKAGDTMMYLYDFGDGWEHSVVLEAINPNEQIELPVCIDGKGACPPEDIGGIHSYYAMVAALSDPQHPEYEHYRNYLGLDEDESWDPHYFDMEETNDAIAMMFDYDESDGEGFFDDDDEEGEWRDDDGGDEEGEGESAWAGADEDEDEGGGYGWEHEQEEGR